MSVSTEIKAILDLNNELRGLAESVLSQHPHPDSLVKGHALLSFGKAYKTHVAILILCEKGYGEDAAILARSLFELAVSTLYVYGDESGIAAKRYFEYDWIIREGMYDYLLSKEETKKGLEEQIAASENGEMRIEEIRKRAADVRAGYTPDELRRNTWSGKSIKKMAEEVGREDSYRTIYSLQCNMAHSAVSMANDYVKEVEGEITMDISPSENWVTQTLVASMDFFYFITRTWNSVFELGLEEKLDDLEKKYIDTVRKFNKA